MSKEQTKTNSTYNIFPVGSIPYKMLEDVKNIFRRKMRFNKKTLLKVSSHKVISSGYLKMRFKFFKTNGNPSYKKGATFKAAHNTNG